MISWLRPYIFTSVTLAELLLGIHILPEGTQRVALAASLGEGIQTVFGPLILTFDADAALAAGVTVINPRLARSP